MRTRDKTGKTGKIISHYDANGVHPRAIPPDSLIQQVRYVVCGEKNLHDLPPDFMSNLTGTR